MVTQVPTNRQTRRHRGTGHSHLLAIVVTAACCFALHMHETCCTNNRNQRLNAAPLQTAGSSSETVTGPTKARSPRHAQVGSTSKTAPDLPHCSDAQAPRSAHSRRVLVTGAAGFIGYHTCKALATQPDTFVLGLDNFNTHYNSSLKLLRKQRLHQVGINTVTGDIRNETSLQELFACYRFTQVVHLAARAGVRQSGTEAGEYVSSNVVGTAVLMEVMRRQNQPLPSLVYASSSSVYGIPSRQCSSSSSSGGGGGSSDGMGGAMDTCCCQLPVQLHGNMQHLCMPAGQQQHLGARHLVNSSSSSNSRRAPGIDTAHFLSCLGMQPSQECSAPCSTPASVYAATKVATEKLVAVYVHQYNLRATGLRFFTVYGPLGRPDMAVMSFTKKLLAGEPVDILCFPVQPMLRPAGVAGQASAQQTAPQQAQQLQEQQQQQQQRLQTQKSKRRSIQDPQLEGDEAGMIAMHGRRTEIMQVRARSHPQGQPAAAYSVPTPPNDCIPTFRDFTAVSDVVHGILAACNKTAASLAVGDNHSVPNVTDGGPAKGRQRIYNIGFGQPHSTLALLQHLQQLLGVQGRVRFVRAGAGVPDAWATWADTTAAQRELGFRAAVHLSEGLQEFGDWYVSDAAAVQHL